MHCLTRHSLGNLFLSSCNRIGICGCLKHNILVVRIHSRGLSDRGLVAYAMSLSKTKSRVRIPPVGQISIYLVSPDSKCGVYIFGKRNRSFWTLGCECLESHDLLLRRIDGCVSLVNIEASMLESQSSKRGSNPRQGTMLMWWNGIHASLKN